MGAHKDSSNNCITINISNEGRLQTLRAVLAYEAAVRGLTLGQAFEQLVYEAADTQSYPSEVREKLDAARAESRMRALHRAMVV